MILTIVLAVLAAVSNAASNVLQRAANREEPEERSLSPRLILDLVRRKVWLQGFVATVASFLLQAGALSQGALSVVQPVIVLELPLTLLAAMMVLHAEMHRQEWMASALMTAGLATLVAFLHPEAGTGRPSELAWAIGGGASVAFIAVLVGVGRARSGQVRAALFGAATGVAFGLTAAFMKAMTTSLSAGIGSLLTSWTTYALVVTGLSAMFLLQSALQAGQLMAAQPGITVLDPFVAIAWGVLAFHEQTGGGGHLALAGVGAAVMAAGAVLLSRSPVLARAQAETESGSDEAERCRAW